MMHRHHRVVFRIYSSMSEVSARVISHPKSFFRRNDTCFQGHSYLRYVCDIQSAIESIAYMTIAGVDRPNLEPNFVYKAKFMDTWSRDMLVLWAENRDPIHINLNTFAHNAPSLNRYDTELVPERFLQRWHVSSHLDREEWLHQRTQDRAAVSGPHFKSGPAPTVHGEHDQRVRELLQEKEELNAQRLELERRLRLQEASESEEKKVPKKMKRPQVKKETDQ